MTTQTVKDNLAQHKQTDTIIPTAKSTGGPPPVGSAIPAKTLTTTIPPIRSFSTRNALHYTSNDNLRREPDGSGHYGDHITNAAPTITEVIAKLESILEEAIRFAQTGAETDTPIQGEFWQPPGMKRRRPSQSITTRGMQYLEYANRKHLSRRDDGHVEHGPADAKAFASRIFGQEDEARLNSMLEADRAKPNAKESLEIHPPSSNQGPKSISGRQQPHISRELPDTAEIKAYIRSHNKPLITPLTSSRSPNLASEQPTPVPPVPQLRLNDEQLPKDEGEEASGAEKESSLNVPHPRPVHQSSFSRMFGVKSRHGSVDLSGMMPTRTNTIDLKRVTHVDVWNKPERFDVFDTCSHAPVARDWPSSRKRFTATIVCINTSCIGMLIGIFAGEVPAIQYAIADSHHFTILGNVVLYCGLAISTLIFWPLPLLHGRKTYTVIGLALTFALQIPQGIAVGDFRMPDDVKWRVLLLFSRAVSGIALGLVNINLQTTLLDLFGASLRSNHPHGEIPDPHDARRHGGGMGLWLAAWCWCSIGSISFGFVIGAFIIGRASVDWGFWTSLLLLMFVMILNVVTPEVRRSAFRRTLAEIVGQSDTFSRVTRGEIKMHVTGNGPYWWGEEIGAGLRLSALMILQPGFAILALYAGWAYAQFTLVMMLLGALTSKQYRFKPLTVGLCVLSMVIGSLLAIPFQKGSFLSRARSKPPRTNSMTFHKAGFRSSHLVRRVLFMVLLPLSGLGYALTSWGSQVPVAIPCILSATLAYLSNLAIAECFGLIMETFDTSDLQPGMTGRPARGSVVRRSGGSRTNFTCYPRVSAGMAVTQSFQFALAAAATGVGGRFERRLGAMRAALVVAAILLGLTLLLTMVLWRWKSVQMIPSRQTSKARPTRRHTEWEPVVLGSPSGVNRKLSILEAGRQTRWSEIRRRNRLDSKLTGS